MFFSFLQNLSLPPVFLSHLCLSPLPSNPSTRLLQESDDDDDDWLDDVDVSKDHGDGEDDESLSGLDSPANTPKASGGDVSETSSFAGGGGKSGAGGSGEGGGGEAGGGGDAGGGRKAAAAARAG